MFVQILRLPTIAGHVQTVGMLWSADRHGVFLPDTLESLRSGENGRGMKWIFAYDNAGALRLRENQEIWEYVSNNYSVREMGIIKLGNVEKQLYQILERGGSINASKPDQSSLKLRKRYVTSYGEVEFYSLRAD